MPEGQSAQIVIPGTGGKVKLKRRTALILAGAAGLMIFLLLRRRDEDGEAEEIADLGQLADEQRQAEAQAAQNLTAMPELAPIEAQAAPAVAAQETGGFDWFGFDAPVAETSFEPASAGGVETAPWESGGGGGGGGELPELAPPVGQPSAIPPSVKPPALSGQTKGAPSGAPTGTIRRVGPTPPPSGREPPRGLPWLGGRPGGIQIDPPIHRMTDRISPEAAQRAQAAGRDKQTIPGSLPQQAKTLSQSVWPQTPAPRRIGSRVPPRRASARPQRRG